MPHARANTGRAAKRPVGATSGASLPLDASLLSIVANLEGLDLDGLRRQWRAHLGGEAPAHLSRWLLMKVLATGSSPTHSAIATNRSEGSFALGKRMVLALPSTAARLRRERARV
jgi:hypothetical protein